MKYKEFVLTLSSFNCNKNCPYCTAKITRWPIVDDQIHLLERQLLFLKEKGITFRYFVFSGNGEPSLHSYETIQKVCRALKNVNIFDEKRFQSSGNIFFEPEKLKLIKDDFIVEITRVAFDPEEDMKTLGYKQNYLESPLFRKATVRLNYVLMKNKKFEEYLTDIKRYIDTYPNIGTVSLKTLNLNTRNDCLDNPHSQWIMAHALTKKDSDDIVRYMSEHAEFQRKDEKFFDRYEWIYAGKPITFYVKKLDYGLSNVIYYGGKLVNYHLQPLHF